MMTAFSWLVANWTFNLTHWWVWMLVALAAFRWASFLVDEEGPFGMFAWLRLKRGVVLVKGVGQISKRPTAFACIKCMSVWVSFWLLILPWQVSVVFAVSAFAIMWGRWSS